MRFTVPVCILSGLTGCLDSVPTTLRRAEGNRRVLVTGDLDSHTLELSVHLADDAQWAAGGDQGIRADASLDAIHSPKLRPEGDQANAGGAVEGAAVFIGSSADVTQLAADTAERVHGSAEVVAASAETTMPISGCYNMSPLDGDGR